MHIIRLMNGQKVERLTEIERLPGDGFVWLDFVRDEEPDWARKIQQISGQVVHERHVSDSMNQTHPSFYDATQEYDMLVFQGIAGTDHSQEFTSRSTVFFLFSNMLVTVHDRDSVSIPLVRDKLLHHSIRIPFRPVGLLHLVLAAMVDRFLALREPLVTKLDTWRNDLLDPDNPFDDWMVVFRHNTYLRHLTMLCDGQHDALLAWREETDIAFDDHLAVRYSDLIEHIHRVIKFAADQKSEVDSLIQLHFAAVAHRTNEIVRVLTVISAIFLPLTVIVGIFGMNFEYMPELKWRYGYFMVLGGMLGLGLGLLLLFRKKHWI